MYSNGCTLGFIFYLKMMAQTLAYKPARLRGNKKKIEVCMRTHYWSFVRSDARVKQCISFMQLISVYSFGSIQSKYSIILFQKCFHILELLATQYLFFFFFFHFSVFPNEQKSIISFKSLLVYTNVYIANTGHGIQQLETHV